MPGMPGSFQELLATEFVRYAGNPLIPHSNVPGCWKEWQVEEAFVFPDPDDASRLVMFYSGARPPGAGGAFVGAAYASVADPFTWTDYPGNPVLSPGASPLNEVYIRLDTALYVEGEYWLYSTGMSADATHVHGHGHNSILLARSRDGRNFTWDDIPILVPSGDEIDVSQGAVLRDGDAWYMYYSYRTATATLPGIRLAVSPDGRHWEKTGQDVLTVAPGGYDAQYYEFHQALKLGEDYVLISECYDGAHWSIGAAHSKHPDRDWVKSPRPLFERSAIPGAFDVAHVATPTLFAVDDRLLLFYQGGNNEADYIMSNWDIGVAVAH